MRYMIQEKDLNKNMLTLNGTLVKTPHTLNTKDIGKILTITQKGVVRLESDEQQIAREAVTA